MRQRRNKAATRATLYVLDSRTKEPPQLPDGDWHELTLQWWRNVWSSPMAPEYLEADLHGLILLAHLIEQYWRDPQVKTAAEIRAQSQLFGLSPLDRRRLQWEVRRVEGGGVQRPGGRAGAPAPTRRDPRSILRTASGA